MDRAEAIRKIEYGLEMETSEQTLFGQLTVVNTDALKMAITALREQERSQWISVKERLPEDDVEVLTRRATGMSVETHCSFGWLYDEYNGKWTVTHWMPLPEPPKEGADHA